MFALVHAPCVGVLISHLYGDQMQRHFAHPRELGRVGVHVGQFRLACSRTGEPSDPNRQWPPHRARYGWCDCELLSPPNTLVSANAYNCSAKWRSPIQRSCQPKRLPTWVLIKIKISQISSPQMIGSLSAGASKTDSARFTATAASVKLPKKPARKICAKYDAAVSAAP